MSQSIKALTSSLHVVFECLKVLRWFEQESHGLWSCFLLGDAGGVCGGGVRGEAGGLVEGGGSS